MSLFFSTMNTKGDFLMYMLKSSNLYLRDSSSSTSPPSSRCLVINQHLGTRARNPKHPSYAYLRPYTWPPPLSLHVRETPIHPDGLSTPYPAHHHSPPILYPYLYHLFQTPRYTPNIAQHNPVNPMTYTSY